MSTQNTLQQTLFLVFAALGPVGCSPPAAVPPKPTPESTITTTPRATMDAANVPSPSPSESIAQPIYALLGAPCEEKSWAHLWTDTSPPSTAGAFERVIAAMLLGRGNERGAVILSTGPSQNVKLYRHGDQKEGLMQMVCLDGRIEALVGMSRALIQEENQRAFGVFEEERRIESNDDDSYRILRRYRRERQVALISVLYDDDSAPLGASYYVATKEFLGLLERVMSSSGP